MISRVQASLAMLALVASLAISFSACDKVPLLAPGGSVITLTTPVTALPTNGSADIVAQVIEPAGTPPQRGTLVSFTTTLGSIQPAQAETDSSGIVRVKFLAGTSSGTALITAISGGVAVTTQNAVRILVGSAAVGRVNVSANPTLLPAIGGATTITAQVLDVNGNPLGSAPVSFGTTAGQLDQGFATSDSSGLATTTLRTASTATVTAAVGATAGTGGGGTTTPPAGGTAPTTPAAAGQASGTVTVNVSAAPAVVITPPTNPGEGLPASFTIAVTAATTNGSAVRDVTIDWGDGSAAQNLGVVTGNAVVAHVYKSVNVYTVTVTATDSLGNVVRTSTSVSVIPVALPTVNITPSVPAQAGVGGTNVTFTIQVTPPSGVTIRSTLINFGDGITNNLGAVNGNVVVTHQYLIHGSVTVTVTVEDSLDPDGNGVGRVTTGTTSIVVP